MGQRVSRSDFEWVYTEEPHASRRKLILEKYPQIKKLFGYDPNFKWVVTGMVLVQFASMFIVKDLSYPMLFLMAYCFGGVINHSLMLVSVNKFFFYFSGIRGFLSKEWGFFFAVFVIIIINVIVLYVCCTYIYLSYISKAIHEISHNLAFGHARPMANKLFGFFANLPIGVPISISFKKYHLEHHRYQGDEKLDTDLPTLLEAKLFCTTFGKLCWVILQPFFYSFRPLVTYPKVPTTLEYINLAIQLIFDAIVWYFLGGKVLVYLTVGSVMAMGLHPVAGHFISEHYMYKKGFETYSYYGPLNFITFNVGYHNEHHDFPAVPGSRLPEVRRIAPEFYKDLPQHNSWVSVLYDFIMDPEIGPYARIKRKHRGLTS